MACWKNRPFFSLSCPLTPKSLLRGFPWISHCRDFFAPTTQSAAVRNCSAPPRPAPHMARGVGIRESMTNLGKFQSSKDSKNTKQMRETCVQLIQDLKGSGKTEDITLCFAKQKKSPPATSKWTCAIFRFRCLVSGQSEMARGCGCSLSVYNRESTCCSLHSLQII